MGAIFKKPKVAQVAAPTPEQVQDTAEEEAREEVERLRKGRVKTILTTGQGLASDVSGQKKTVLGG